MISYAQALSRAKAAKSDWNEEERISKAVITWVDSEWEHETGVTVPFRLSKPATVSGILSPFSDTRSMTN